MSFTIYENYLFDFIKYKRRTDARLGSVERVGPRHFAGDKDEVVVEVLCSTMR